MRVEQSGVKDQISASIENRLLTYFSGDDGGKLPYEEGKVDVDGRRFVYTPPSTLAEKNSCRAINVSIAGWLTWF